MEKTSLNQTELRKFGFILTTGIVILFVLLPFLLHQHFNTWLLVASGILIFIAQFQPTWLKMLYHPWMKVGHVLGWINTRIILGFVFFVLITPIGIIRQLCGKDAMQRAYRPKLNSYRKISTQQSPQQMEKPY